MPKIDIAAVPERKGTYYPRPFDEPSVDRVRQRLGDAGGLTDFGVNLMHLPPAIGRANATGIPTRMNSSMCSQAR